MAHGIDLGACLLLAETAASPSAEQYVPSGLASVMVATVPIYIALSPVSGNRSATGADRLARLAGVFAGVAILLGPALHFRLTKASIRGSA